MIHEPRSLQSTAPTGEHRLITTKDWYAYGHGYHSSFPYQSKIIMNAMHGCLDQQQGITGGEGSGWRSEAGCTDSKTTAIIYTHVPDETRRIATVNLEEVFGSRGMDDVVLNYSFK